MLFHDPQQRRQKGEGGAEMQQHFPNRISLFT